MKRYEYKVEHIKMGLFGAGRTDKEEEQLNEWGRQGWELVLAYEVKPCYKFIFKREIA